MPWLEEIDWFTGNDINEYWCRSFDSNSIQVECSFFLSLRLSIGLISFTFLCLLIWHIKLLSLLFFSLSLSVFVKCSFVYLSFRVRSVDQFRRTTTKTSEWMKWSKRLCNEQLNKADNIFWLVVWSKGWEDRRAWISFLLVTIFPFVWRWPFPFSHSPISFLVIAGSIESARCSPSSSVWHTKSEVVNLLSFPFSSRSRCRGSSRTNHVIVTDDIRSLLLCRIMIIDRVLGAAIALKAYSFPIVSLSCVLLCFAVLPLYCYSPSVIRSFHYISLSLCLSIPTTYYVCRWWYR